MKREQILALKATFFIVIAIIISCFSLFFWILWDNSIFDFFKDIFYWIFSNKLTTLSAFLSILIISFIIYLIVYYFWKKHFEKIDNYNKNLKDYNHYLAHELKTPISVIFSNLEVLKYWFDEKIVKKSQEELKNMINIIDVLLSFSESLNISERDDINLENFLKAYINSYFSDQKNNIFIENREFNFYIETNEILFKRIVRNLIENALKYSKDKKLFIKIENKKIIFENKIEKDYTEEEIQKLISKGYRSEKIKNWYWLWLSLIKEILRFLWYHCQIYSKENNTDQNRRADKGSFQKFLFFHRHSEKKIKLKTTLAISTQKASPFRVVFRKSITRCLAFCPFLSKVLKVWPFPSGRSEAKSLANLRFWYKISCVQAKY